MQKTFEKFLGGCARRTILRDKPTVVAIVGSVGKSTVRYAVSLALGGRFSSEEVRFSKKNYNNELGVPLSVFDCEMPGRSPYKWLKLFLVACLYALGLKKLKLRYLVLEMAADHPGDLDYLISIAPPQVAIVTALGVEHTEFFGSSEAAVEEERKIIQALPQDGELILNADDPLVWEIRSLTKVESVCYGKQPEACVFIQSVRTVYDSKHAAEAGLEIELMVLKNHVFSLRLEGVCGETHAYAIAAAIAFCVSQDLLSAPAIQHVQDHYAGLPGRMRLIPGIKRTMLIDDSYNAQPQAMRAAVKELADFPVPPGGRRIAALGDMLELGVLTEEEHQKVGQQVAAANLDFLVCCGKLARIMGQAAAQAGLPEDRISYFDTSSEAGMFIQNQVLQFGDVVLVKGSQGARMEKITKELMAHPDRAAEQLVRHSPEWLART